MVVVDCDLIAESGEYPIPFADRMNVLEDWAAQAPDNAADNTVPYFVGGKGGDEVQPGAKPTDLEVLRKAYAKADSEDSMRTFGIEEAR
jgi:hypothetical protein